MRGSLMATQIMETHCHKCLQVFFCVVCSKFTVGKMGRNETFWKLAFL